MLSKDDFINFVIEGKNSSIKLNKDPEESALPEGFDGFDEPSEESPADKADSSFARMLLEASGFGYAELVQRDNVIRSTDAVARYLPDRVSFWPKTRSRSYQTLLFEAEINHRQLLEIPAFKSRKMNHLDIVEDALARLVSEALEGFQKGGEGVTADVRKGRREETLCVVSILDEREGQPVRLVCFGTQNETTKGLETFQITEQTRFWDPQHAREHLGLVYERQFKKLGTMKWQEAFTTTEERKQAENLLEVCMRKSPRIKDIQENVLNLLDTIAKGFGLRKKPKTERRLQAFSLPSDHDIGIDPEERESSFGGQNTFGGVTLRDERSRLLGYIIYPLGTKNDANRLRQHLEENNRFHNVLVVYPDEDQTILELWQGKEQLTGKLKKGQGYKDAADVVNLLSRFFVVSKAKVKNPSELAKELAYRARYLRSLSLKQLRTEEKSDHLQVLFQAFKKSLISDLTDEDFSDAYAQTLTYGLLFARWVSKDNSSGSNHRFSRTSAYKFLPATSPFLKQFFKNVLKASFEFKLTWLLDDIADLLDRVDIDYVFSVGDRNNGDSTDPVIHFYEPFLYEYDAETKQSRGVFYTPDAIVSFMVRSVDQALRNQLSLPLGIADCTKWKEYAERCKIKIPKGRNPDDPVVTILDPAVGTGTFLKHSILLIHQTMIDDWKEKGKSDKQISNLWDKYVNENLLNRIYGFEVMVAPYAICHLKLALTLKQTGFSGSFPTINIRLTNSLREANVKEQNDLFDEMMTEESSAANEIKNGLKSIFIIIGNPPYSGHSANLFEDSKRLVERYRFIQGNKIIEKGALQFERNLQDDYVKFISLCQSILKRTHKNVWCFVTNHGFIDGPTLSGLRYALLEDFTTLHVLNLHGNINRGEVTPEGDKDENVFPIKDAGVAITLGVCEHYNSEKNYCKSFYFDKWGLKESKLNFLSRNSCQSIEWKKTNPRARSFLLNAVSSQIGDEYASFLPLDKIVKKYSNGIVTARDALVIDFEKNMLIERINDFAFREGATEKVCKDLNVSLKKGWDAKAARHSIRAAIKNKEDWIFECLYRPFEKVYLYYHPALIQTMSSTSWHMAAGENIAMLVPRTVKGGSFQHILLTDQMSEAICLSTKTSVNGNCFPLWLYDGAKDLVLKDHGLRKGNLKIDIEKTRSTNFKKAFLDLIKKHVGLDLAQEEIFLYIACILHSGNYQTRYSKIIGNAFPRIPIPKEGSLVSELSKIGKMIFDLYCLKYENLERKKVELIGQGDGIIKKAIYKKEEKCIFINENQYIRQVDSEAWSFSIGDYSVIKRWLVGGRAVTRKGMRITENDLRTLSMIVAAIRKLNEAIVKIDRIIENYGGWPDAFATKISGE